MGGVERQVSSQSHHACVVRREGIVADWAWGVFHRDLRDLICLMRGEMRAVSAFN